jgi:hypothetical protein
MCIYKYHCPCAIYETGAFISTNPAIGVGVLHLVRRGLAALSVDIFMSISGAHSVSV